MKQQKVFYISDGTGITATNLGKSLLTQFDSISFDEQPIPDIKSTEDAEHAVEIINQAAHQQGYPVLVFSTLINDDIRQLIENSEAFVLDLFATFIKPLEDHLQTKSSHSIGKTHGLSDYQRYMQRINAMNFSLQTDDGCHPERYDLAELILVGVSRCGKTPTSLYLALQYGIYTANYPFTIDDMQDLQLPKSLRAYKHKIYGLTISPQRLQQIRQERRPDSQYADINQCKKEIKIVEDFFKRTRINYLDTSRRSIEEIASTIMASMSG